MVPKRLFLTKGVGRAKERLESFEMALRDAQIAVFNLVKVSSIFPPGCKIVSRKDGLKNFSPGEIVHCVLATSDTNEPNRLIATSIGLARPRDPKLHGYLSEHHSHGETEFVSGEYAEDLAAKMLASTLGIPFDPDAAWDERKQVWNLQRKSVRTQNITQSAVGDKRGRWTTVLAAAVLIV